ncbi:TPA: U32 family peptidase C-terminal domain-containing protein [Candidatus Galligastranaerophilus intestinavium]|uniref:U32 family peptidase C-terminal domain-containing protein n=1 Tax=Candidatus Galligastranaerophilus intestinavium TaxID=2840836 RepID=A0A9D1FIV2_9BACT|nr:U32 family peptidase C-terminal domain-containing protein [Candidatus Galligastranaerophilus intestinavium]
MSELLMPAGNIEKMKYAYAYGADACYLGLVDFSLRTMRKGELITRENLKYATDAARALNKKAYLTLNIFAYDEDIKSLEESIEIIKNANPHAIILSDFGVYRTVRKYMPDIDLHISTQTNILNIEAVKFWRDMGATRVILARELSLKQIEAIKKAVPDIEVEIFVHGSQCMSYSGRCLLSDYMTKGERKANHGGCAQPCRWSYKLLEETRPGEYYEIVQDERGSHILSPKDLCLVRYIKDLQNIGVDSFKVEGRTKSLYYVSAVTKAYRAVMDGKLDSENAFCELKKVGNRGFTEGFFMGDNNSSSYSYEISKGLAGADFLCIFLDKKDNLFKVVIKNKMLLGDEFEIITPDYCARAKVVSITNKDGVKTDVANTNDEVWMELIAQGDWQSQWQWALGRTLGIKNEIET